MDRGQTETGDKVEQKELAGDDNIRQQYHSEFIEDDNSDENASDGEKVEANPEPYSQLGKWALANVFGVILLWKFAIASDYKPLQYLLNESHTVSTMASVRLQYWARAYQYTISYLPVEKLAGLSRLPLPDTLLKNTVSYLLVKSRCVPATSSLGTTVLPIIV